MKAPIEWNEIPEVAGEIIDLIDAASRDGETKMDVWFDGSRNSYGENGTFTIQVGNRTFQLTAYEVAR